MSEHPTDPEGVAPPVDVSALPGLRPLISKELLDRIDGLAIIVGNNTTITALNAKAVVEVSRAVQLLERLPAAIEEMGEALKALSSAAKNSQLIAELHRESRVLNEVVNELLHRVDVLEGKRPAE